jgi:hypothetical protein
VTRSARTLRVADSLLRDLDKAWSIAMGDGNSPGPFTSKSRPTCCASRAARCRARRVPRAEAPPRIVPDPDDVARAAALIARAKRCS